jgi:hypothetical protein
MPNPAEPSHVEMDENVERIMRSHQILQSSPGAPSPQTDIDRLLVRMRAGDRDAAAEFLMRYGSRIRRRIRGKLGPSIRRLFDSLEILSTLGRRLDLYVMSGRVNAANEAQLWTLVCKMADNALIEKGRLFRRLQNAEGEDGEFAQALARRLRKAESANEVGVEIEIEKCMRSIGDPVDRRILALWLSGEPHLSIAEHIDLAPTAVRKRWERIRSELKNRLMSSAA